MFSTKFLCVHYMTYFDFHGMQVKSSTQPVIVVLPLNHTDGLYSYSIDAHMKLKYYILETILWSSFRGTTKMYLLFSSNKLVEYYIFIHFKLIKFLMTGLLIMKGSSNVQSRWDQPHPHTFLPPCTSNFCYLCDNCCEHTVHGCCCIFSKGISK
jgi:hypothetical protein